METKVSFSQVMDVGARVGAVCFPQVLGVRCRSDPSAMCALVDVKSAELRVNRFCDVAAIKCSRVCSAWCLCRAELLTREEFHRVQLPSLV